MSYITIVGVDPGTRRAGLARVRLETGGRFAPVVEAVQEVDEAAGPTERRALLWDILVRPERCGLPGRAGYYCGTIAVPEQVFIAVEAPAYNAREGVGKAPASAAKLAEDAGLWVGMAVGMGYDVTRVPVHAWLARAKRWSPASQGGAVLDARAAGLPAEVLRTERGRIRYDVAVAVCLALVAGQRIGGAA